MLLAFGDQPLYGGTQELFIGVQLVILGGSLIPEPAVSCRCLSLGFLLEGLNFALFIQQ